MSTPTAKFTVRKVEVYRLVDEHGREVGQYDDEYGHEYPLDFESDVEAWEHAAREESLGFHGPLTQAEAALRAAYSMFALQNLKASTPFMSLTRRPLPMNSGKSIQFVTY